jgi:hypothetical protein
LLNSSREAGRAHHIEGFVDVGAQAAHEFEQDRLVGSDIYAELITKRTKAVSIALDRLARLLYAGIKALVKSFLFYREALTKTFNKGGPRRDVGTHAAPPKAGIAQELDARHLELLGVSPISQLSGSSKKL